MPATFYAQNLAALKRLQPSNFTTQEQYDGDPYESVYLGTVFALDPCGRYHHAILSPNGLSSRCAAYWEALDKAADRLGGWIESGEGDPCNIYFCRALPEVEESDESVA